MNKQELIESLVGLLEVTPLVASRRKMIGYMAGSNHNYTATLNGFEFVLSDYGHYHNFPDNGEYNPDKNERLWSIERVNDNDFYWHTREIDGVIQYSEQGTFHNQTANDWVNI